MQRTSAPPPKSTNSAPNNNAIDSIPVGGGKGKNPAAIYNASKISFYAMVMNLKTQL
jgi:hypothetical protein